MTFSLYQDEINSNVSLLPGTSTPPAGAWDNFLLGTGRYAMKGFAEVARSASMAGAAVPIAVDALTNITMGRTETPANETTAAARYFKFHDETFGRAVDYWTPKPHEVGAAAQITGQLLSTLPMVMLSPHAAVASAQLSAAEDLVNKGVDAGKAQAVGAVQGASLATGIWMPILGRTGFERAVVGGLGFNVGQGLVTRAASGKILEGTPAAGDFKAFDGTAITLDALMGLAFGGLAHLSPAQRAQGEAMWRRIEAWSKGLKPSELDALAVLRQAQHTNEDSAPGKPASLSDIDAHVARQRRANEQFAGDQPVSVEDMPAPTMRPDPARTAAAEQRIAMLQREAGRISKDEDIDFTPKPTLIDIPEGKRKALKYNDVLLDDYARQVENQYGLPPGLLVAIKNAGERSNSNQVSTAGAKGVMQFIPETYRIFGKGDPTDPVNSINAAGAYFSDLLKRYGGNVDAAITEYNGGVKQAQAVAAGGKPFVKETADYLPRVKQHMAELDRGGRIPPKAAPEGAAKAANPANADPVAAEAMRFADENPDIRIAMGKDANDNPVFVTPHQVLDDARVLIEKAEAYAKLFDIAALCMMGG